MTSSECSCVRLNLAALVYRRQVKSQTVKTKTRMNLKILMSQEDSVLRCSKTRFVVGELVDLMLLKRTLPAKRAVPSVSKEKTNSRNRNNVLLGTMQMSPWVPINVRTTTQMTNEVSRYKSISVA